MIPSAQLDFSLQLLLQQLDQAELSKFKSLLRMLCPKDELEHIPQMEVDEADGKQLAEILTNHCASYWVEMVAIQIFDMMDRTDLSQRAKDELREAALKSLQENKPLSLELTKVQGEDVKNLGEAKEGLEGRKPVLFGLANERMAGELETTFGCRVTTGVAQELLKSEPFWTMDLSEVMRCLHESQEELLVRDAMDHVTEVSLRVKTRMDLVHSSFCLRHCQNLQKILLQVEKGIFLESDTALESDTPVERSKNDQHMLPFWVDLCSMFGSNKNLMFLDISQSFLSTSSVRILYEKIASATHNLQKVVLKNISPADAYQKFCIIFRGHKTLTHLTLQGNDQNNMLPSLCEVLRHPKCNLKYLRLVSCSATTQQWADLSSSLEMNQSLICLNLMANELLDEGAKLLYMTLRHPKCFLQRLLLEDCDLTGAYCKELSSALIVNQRLTHLCLAKNALGNHGVKLLCEGLSYPECQLQTLVLYYCNITSDGCVNLSVLLQQNSNLTHLDLGLNHIGITGLKFLCESLKTPLCNLRCLWLWGCAITPLSCADLSSALSSNQNLITLDLGQNSLGYSGVKMLCDALKRQSCPLQTLRLKIDKSDAQLQRLLEEIKESNPHLTIERDNQDPKNKRPSSHDFIF
ncbi:NACHT, LRR and PYD domains-containing protein 2 [Pteropus vampyrus]|uniref:NACHT, LRR and PYD domains-containing protein 2 n=1 Tax=Pteropus vampyrus TaxID=132908 RepID=A0A6P6BTU1_PTEVA|nr:NACHT, LRR and PYD domains-containing protein 2 [Pteropus vampyrus]